MKDRDIGLALPFRNIAAREDPAADEVRLERLYNEHSESLFRYALALTNSPDDAEDAVQEVFARMAREKARLRSVRDPKPYLMASVRNEAYTILRGRLRKDRLDESLRDGGIATCPGAEDTVVNSDVLREAFAGLPVEQREVVVLKVYDGMTFREIADLTGGSPNTAASRYRYAIDRLGQAMETLGAGPGRQIDAKTRTPRP